MWVKQPDGSHVPTKTGVTVRAKEILEVGKALRKAFDTFQAETAFKLAPTVATLPMRPPPLEDELTANGYF